MKTLLLRSLWIAGALVLAATAGLARPIQERRPVDPDVLVTIRNINGSVTIEGWSQKEIEITGEISDDLDDLVISGSASRMTIEVDYPERSRHIRAEAVLDIKLPVGAGVRVEVVNAPISVSKIQGELELEAVNGKINIDGKPSRIEAQTVNGTIEITAACSRVEAQSVGGRILLDGVDGDLSAGTVGGSVRVAGGKFERLRLSTVSGSLDFDGSLDGKATVECESHSGDVVMRLPGNVSADFDLSTFSGDIANDFGPSGRKRGYGPGKSVSFTTGDGDARVRLSTFSGDIELVKK